MHFGNFTDTKGISQDFSDCGLRNDKSTKNSPRENCVSCLSANFGEAENLLDVLM